MKENACVKNNLYHTVGSQNCVTAFLNPVLFTRAHALVISADTLTKELCGGLW